MSEIGRRKDDHLELCATDDVAYRGRTTLLECVQLPHQSLPELAIDELDPSVVLFGKRLRFPIIIASMTGGSDAAAEINRELSSIAEARGYGFGVGSQRAMQRAPESAWTYEVRKQAPTTLVLGNVGVVQARDVDTKVLDGLVAEIGADALGAHAAGIARPVLQALKQGGRPAVEALLSGMERELTTAMILSGARTLAQLRQCTPVLTGELPRWLDAG